MFVWSCSSFASVLRNQTNGVQHMFEYPGWFIINSNNGRKINYLHRITAEKMKSSNNHHRTIDYPISFLTWNQFLHRLQPVISLFHYLRLSKHHSCPHLHSVSLFPSNISLVYEPFSSLTQRLEINRDRLQRHSSRCLRRDDQRLIISTRTPSPFSSRCLDFRSPFDFPGVPNGPFGRVHPSSSTAFGGLGSLFPPALSTIPASSSSANDRKSDMNGSVAAAAALGLDWSRFHRTPGSSLLPSSTPVSATSENLSSKKLDESNSISTSDK